jgi:hypothetical protein
MYKILGISHLVFSVNKNGFKNSEYLKSNFLTPDNFEFDHSKIRKPLLRNSSNKISRISFYKPINPCLPAIELIESNNLLKRPQNSFGIIDKTLKKNSQPSTLIKLGNQQTITSYFCPIMNTNISFETDIIDSETGCWIEVFDFKSQINLLRKNFNLNCYYEDDSTAKFKTRIINKSLYPFHIVLIKSSKHQSFYNDDLGLSSFGWFSKNLQSQKNIDLFKISDHFKINLYDNELNAQFIYDNKLFSHEILKLNI